MIGKLLALLGTKQGVLAVLVTVTVLLGAGFGFLAPMGTDAQSDGPTTDDEVTPSPERTSTPAESPPADDGSSGDDAEDVSTTTPPSSSTSPSADGETDETGDRGDDADGDDANRGSTNAGNGNGDADGDPAETLDLRLGLQDGRALVDVDAAVPGQTGASTVSVRNAGSLDGRLDVSVGVVEQHENGLTEPEREVDDSPEQGELGKWMKFRVSLPNEDGDGRTYLVGSADGYVSPTRVDDESTTAALSSREQRDLLVEWCITTDAGNEIQSDSVRLAFEFTLVQS
jgi:hypothetical protein